MPDQKEVTKTMWQDQHAGKRGHQLMTERLAETIPALYANEKVADYDTVLARIKLFSPYSNWTWYVTEMDPATGTCFGLVDGLEREIGYFDLTELAEATVFGGVPAVQRDLYWQPKTLGEIKPESREDSPREVETRDADATTDETRIEKRPSDLATAEEFLFGAAADDAPADVAGELAAGEATDNVGNMETFEEPDADTETAIEESDVDGDAEEQVAPGETESAVELKVVLSIRGNRATIGVQRPSADPHIESFDNPDLFGLADQFPAAVARAQARWEEEPMHPAYVKPAPPAKRQRQRQQASVEATAEDGGAEAEQPQPETLRLF